MELRYPILDGFAHGDSAIDLLLNGTVEWFLTEEDKIIKALSLNRFHKTFGISVLLWAPYPRTVLDHSKPGYSAYAGSTPLTHQSLSFAAFHRKR
jgi:hypothetical protein